MNSKKTWLGALLFACALVVFTLTSPVLFARDRSEDAAASERYLQLFQYVFGFVRDNYVDEIEPSLLYKGAMKGMLEAIEDPYTSYIDTDSILGRNLQDTTTGAFGGVGLSITKPFVSSMEKPAYVEVAAPIEDTPGWKAGIEPGDLILEIDGTSTPEITMENVLDLLRGPVGTDVAVLLRRGKALEYTVTLTRALIEVPTVKYAMMENGIGYLRIIEFTPLTPGRVQEALDSFSKEGYTSLLIDLRNNPGGLITSVVDVADKFIDSGVIVSTQSRISYENREFLAKSGKSIVPAGFPIVVLINKGSASASEILAGALKDYHLGYLVGETTYGKGSVQQVIDLMNNDAMKMTMARYYTPSGANIDKQGIPPDHAVLIPELTEEEEKALSELLNTTIIADYVAGNKNLSHKVAASYARELKKKYPVELRLLTRLIMQEYYRTHITPLYDLEFDIQLKAAVEILLEGNLGALIKATSTVRELQETAEKTVAAATIGE
ncbi:MAG TPA: S41 family peptidase [Treponema sp.]|nr:S41 family peptidase [Treponema sp.]